LSAELTLAGTAGQFGRAVVEDVSRKLVGEFAARLAAEIEDPAGPRAPTTRHSDAPESPRAVAGPEGVPSQSDALDLTAAGRDLLLRRAVPVGIGVLAVMTLLLGYRRQGRRTRAALVINGPLVVIGRRSGRASGK
jgi:hypothetical protein